MISSGDKLAMWTIYNSPADAPGRFVARKFLIGDVPEATRTAITGDTLQQVRNSLPDGLTCMQRHPSDDPVIVETWF